MHEHDKVECEISIKAPLATVWQVVTKPEYIAHWFGGVSAKIDVRPGGRGTFKWPQMDEAQLWVVDVNEPYLFSYRWISPDNKVSAEDSAILVEFHLSEENDHTKLRIVERGWNELDWTEERKTAYAEDHANGWKQYITDLQVYAENLDK